MTTTQILITINDANNFTVKANDLTSGQLCWDEMLGTIAELTHPALGKTKYKMYTEAERLEYCSKWGHTP